MTVLFSVSKTLINQSINQEINENNFSLTKVQVIAFFIMSGSDGMDGTRIGREIEPKSLNFPEPHLFCGTTP